ncbi:MAG TPA: GGDEF domain-containing protein [Verrucomicrobiae bacterium]|nr:GGDEF domain-containing protein [Verrucomicrobiae bacterium]
MFTRAQKQPKTYFHRAWRSTLAHVKQVFDPQCTERELIHECKENIAMSDIPVALLRLQPDSADPVVVALNEPALEMFALPEVPSPFYFTMLPFFKRHHDHMRNWKHLSEQMRAGRTDHVMLTIPRYTNREDEPLAHLIHARYIGVTASPLRQGVPLVKVDLVDHTETFELKNRDQMVSCVYTDAHGKRCIQSLIEQRHPFAVIFFDIDDFKMFNTKYGHSGGDIVIRELGAILSENIRSLDAVYRKGGDEFCWIVPYDLPWWKHPDILIKTDGVEPIRSDQVKLIKSLARRVSETMRNRTIVIDGVPVRVSVTAGIRIVDDFSDYLDPAGIVNEASLDMIASKDETKILRHTRERLREDLLNIREGKAPLPSLEEALEKGLTLKEYHEQQMRLRENPQGE